MGDGSVTVSAYGLPVVIPDSLDSGGLEGANVIAFVPVPMVVRKVVATVGLEHANPADLYGALTHAGQTAVPNHFTGAPGGFTNTYDDLPDGTTNSYPIIASDGPGTLLNFVGLAGDGQWILNEKDNVFTQTGMVTMLTLTVWPQPQPLNPLDYTNIISNLPPGGSYYSYVDVPDDATNLNIAAGFQSGGPLGIYLTNRPVAGPGDYGTNVNAPGGSLNLSIYPPPLPPTNLLSGGRWYYDITNEGTVAMTNIVVVVTILESLTPNLTVTEFNNTATPLGTDDHTQSQICVTNGVFSVRTSNWRRCRWGCALPKPTRTIWCCI